MLVGGEQRAAYVALLETDCLVPERRRGNPSSGLMSTAIRSCSLAAKHRIAGRDVPNPQHTA